VSERTTDYDDCSAGPYDHTRWDDEPESPPDPADIDEARENVLDGWPASPSSPDAGPEPGRAAAPADDPLAGPEPLAAPADLDSAPAVLDDSLEAAFQTAVEPEQAPPEPAGELESASASAPDVAEHAPGLLVVPPGYAVLEGEADGSRRAVGVVVSRFNGDVTSRLLESALDELERAGVAREAITVMPVPGAFELPLAAMALAKTRRFACIVALGCVIRGETPHFEYVAGEAASGLQLAALETGVPVAFGVLTLESEEQVEARIGKGAEAVRTALEMADAFANLRAAAAV
jgi:6,7-dimethyl-8-ribityllumazine synthase